MCVCAWSGVVISVIAVNDAGGGGGQDRCVGITLLLMSFYCAVVVQVVDVGWL